MTLKIGSLFTGYGGLDMAVHAVFPGAETVWVSDIDKGASKILAHRYPTVPNLGDITGIDWTQVEPVDILTGGFPCQDLSHAGKRAGLKDGTRSGLWSYMAEAVKELSPRLVVVENVRGLLSADAPGDVEPCPWCVGDRSSVNLRALGIVLADLADLGFDARWCGLRAADVGGCHGRFRVFLIAYPNGSGGDQTIKHHGSRTAVGNGASVPNQCDRVPDGVGPLREIGTLLPTPQRVDYKNGMGNQFMLSDAARLLATPMSRDYKGSGTGRLAKSLEKGHLEAQLKLQFGDYAKAITRWELVMGRPAPSPTQQNSKSGREKLSAPFVEWMMGLPAGWVTDVPELSWAEQLKALGNGVVPQQAEAGLRHMLGER